MSLEAPSKRLRFFERLRNGETLSFKLNALGPTKCEKLARAQTRSQRGLAGMVPPHLSRNLQSKRWAWIFGASYAYEHVEIFGCVRNSNRRARSRPRRYRNALLGSMLFVHVSGRESAFFTPQWRDDQPGPENHRFSSPSRRRASAESDASRRHVSDDPLSGCGAFRPYSR